MQIFGLLEILQNHYCPLLQLAPLVLAIIPLHLFFLYIFHIGIHASVPPAQIRSVMNVFVAYTFENLLYANHLFKQYFYILHSQVRSLSSF